MARTRDWHHTDGRWAGSLGERGCRVRLFQIRKGGPFFRQVWVAGRKDQKSLGTSDRRKAERQGRALLARLRQGTASEITPLQVSLGVLCARYAKRCPTYAAYTADMRANVDSRIRVLLAYFGSECDVRELTPDDVTAYSSARQAGGIRVLDREEPWITRSVRPRSVVADLAVLHGMLNWARSYRENGVRLLDANPIAGVRCDAIRIPAGQLPRGIGTPQRARQCAGRRRMPRSRPRVNGGSKPRWRSCWPRGRGGGSVRSASSGGKMWTGYAAPFGGAPSLTSAGRTGLCRCRRRCSTNYGRFSASRVSPEDRCSPATPTRLRR